jgi:predicted Zn finger-like uncharacterized protein
MNIRCPHCQTVFRVDPERIPATGIRARCARCSGVFPIRGPGARAPAGPPAGPAPRAPAPAPEAGTAAGADRERQAAGAPATAVSAAPGPAQPPAAEEDRRSGEAPAAEPAAGRGRLSFGRNTDPGARAQRIARALVSDIVAYHPERVEDARRAGTLRREFRDEIMKSWEEYVAQVGGEMARESPHFRQALNQILAQGEAVF